MSEENLYVEQYKIARNSIEHFDKLLSDFRKIVWGFNSTVVAAVLAFYWRPIFKPDSPAPYTDKTQVKVLFLGSTLFALTNILIWAIEKHYHRYLTISAKVAEEIEENLFDNKRTRLTYQLRRVRNCYFNDEAIPKILKYGLSKISKHIQTYDCIYLFPIVVSEFLNLYLAIRLKDSDIWTTAILLLIFSIIASYVIVRHSYWITNHYDLSK